MENPTVLTFDWDDVSIDNKTVQRALSQLAESFGPERVWYRVSSSGQGLHVLVGELDDTHQLQPLAVEFDTAWSWRTHFFNDPFKLECGGRLRSDNERQAHGFPIGRLFSHKDDQTAGPWQYWNEVNPL